MLHYWVNAMSAVLDDFGRKGWNENFEKLKDLKARFRKLGSKLKWSYFSRSKFRFT